MTTAISTDCVAPDNNRVTKIGIERLEELCLHQPQVEMPLTHRFAPGVYFREIFMPAGTFVIGHEHKTEHFNVVLSGRALVLIEGKTEEIKAPCVFLSGAGVRKVLLIEEDMRWVTIHATHETDITKLELELIIKSESHLKYYDAMKLTGGAL